MLEVKEDSWAEVEVNGVRYRVSLQLFSDVEASDWVLVNLGSVVAKIDEDEAREIMRLYQEIAEADSTLIGTKVNGRRDSNE